jgi:hypothetical protein
MRISRTKSTGGIRVDKKQHRVVWRTPAPYPVATLADVPMPAVRELLVLGWNERIVGQDVLADSLILYQEGEESHASLRFIDVVRFSLCVDTLFVAGKCR